MLNCEYGLSLVLSPSGEPISTEEAKLHCRIPASMTDDDDYIDTLTVTARQYAENFLCQRLLSQTWDIIFDQFPRKLDGSIELPYGPVSSVTSITYTDTGGTGTVWSSANYTVDNKRVVTRIFPAFTVIWPATRNVRNAVTVRAVSGYADAAHVPDQIKHALKIMVAHWFECREPVVFGQLPSNIPKSANALLSQVRSSWL